MESKALMTLAFLVATLTASWAGDYDKELAEVKEGVRTEAKASWWGFDKDDSTKALQDAINSGVKKLIVDNVGGEWLVEPIKLVDNQEIVFEKGVVVAARKGAFKSPYSSLFTAEGRRNIVLRGDKGSIVKMRKADYQDPALYAFGEWRHTISLLSSENIEIRNLTLLSSGGDGIYVGCQNGNPTNYCKNILIDGVVCDDHYRQGISVISAENLIIRNSVFKNTGGTSPEAGLDFEPNSETERLVNCLVENCSFTGNKGSGIDFYLQTKIPLSVTLRNCKITDNLFGIFYRIVKGRTTAFDNIKVVDCVIGGSANANVKIQSANTSFLFKDCTIDNLGNKSPAIAISERRGHSADGIVTLENVKVLDNTPEHVPLAVSCYSDRKFTIKGVVNFVNPGGASKTVNCSKTFDAVKMERITVAAPIDLSKLEAPRTLASTGMTNSIIPIRAAGKFIQFAEKGRKVEMEALAIQVGKNDQSVSLRVVAPNGTEVMNFDLKPSCSWNDLSGKGSWKSLEFTPGETGIYTVECVNNNGNAFRLRSQQPGNGYLLGDELHMVCPRGKLFFQVPAGVKDIKIEVEGDSDEPVDASLLDPKDAVVRSLSKVEAPQLLSWKRKKTSKAEIWSIEFANAAEDCAIRFGEGLLPVVSEKADFLPLLR